MNELRYRLLNSFKEFTLYFFYCQNKKPFTTSEHHNILFNKGHDIVLGKSKNLILNIAPRYGKTEIMVKMFIAWSLARNPKSKFIHLSYSDTLALDNSSAVKDLINSAEYQMLFPYVEIKKDTSAKEKWYTTAGGGVLARSSSGQVTGFGAGNTNFDDEISEFGGAIIIDDPIKPDDANSDTLRERVNNKFDTTLRNRVNSRETPIIIIMQRLHPNDLCGYLLEKEPDEWEHITMPVIKPDGSALWVNKHSLEELNKMRENLGTVFETQYMQNPIPKDGYLLPIQDLRLFLKNRGAELISRLCFIDPAEKNGDFMAVIFMQVELLEGKFNAHIYDLILSNKGFEYLSEIVHERCVETDVQEVIFEKNGVGLATGIKLKSLNEGNYRLTPYHTTENKQAKILNNYEFVSRHYSFPSSYNDNLEHRLFINQLTSYSKGGINKNDDAIDVICSSAKILKIKYKKYFEIK